MFVGGFLYQVIGNCEYCDYDQQVDQDGQVVCVELVLQQYDDVGNFGVDGDDLGNCCKNVQVGSFGFLILVCLLGFGNVLFGFFLRLFWSVSYVLFFFFGVVIGCFERLMLVSICFVVDVNIVFGIFGFE